MFWENKGRENTQKTIDLALKRGGELGVQHFVVASSTGDTALSLAKRGVKTVCVTYHAGFRSPGKKDMTADTEAQLEARGIKVLTTTHLLGGIDRAVENNFGGLCPGGLVAHTLRMFGQGTKVCVEVAVMALDAGLIPYGEDVISIAGSGRGADAAVLLRPAHAKNFFDCEIKEIICKPRAIK